MLVEIPDNNIDNKLGVKNLVIPNRSAPVAKSRISVDQWSANNGSVIYAQSNVVMNGFAPTMANPGYLADRQRETVVYNSKHSNLGTRTMNGRNVSTSPSIISSKDQHQPKEDPATNGSEIFSDIKQGNESRINGIASVLNTTQNEKSRGELEDDLNYFNSSKWSNGTCTTSDLLF